jgi:Putative auto-transporter adhesin, head GIN domain
MWPAHRCQPEGPSADLGGMKYAIPTLAVGALALAFGISSADSPSTSETRTVSEFHAVDLAGTLEVEVTVGKPAKVEVTGEANLLDKVITTVKNGVLVINTKPKLRGHNHLRAIVTVPSLTSLVLSGTGAMKATGITNEELAINLSGTGELTAAGSTGTLHAVVDGTGEIAAKDLAAKDAVVSVNGTGQATLRASRSLEAKLSGTGSIDVHGHPTQVKKSISGVGDIHVR